MKKLIKFLTLITPIIFFGMSLQAQIKTPVDTPCMYPNYFRVADDSKAFARVDMASIVAQTPPLSVAPAADYDFGIFSSSLNPNNCPTQTSGTVKVSYVDVEGKGSCKLTITAGPKVSTPKVTANCQGNLEFEKVKFHENVRDTLGFGFFLYFDKK